MNTETFGISEASLKKVRKRWLTVMVPIYVIVLAIIVGQDLVKEDPGMGLMPSIAGASVACIFLTVAVFRGLARQKQFLQGYTISIDGSQITRQQPNTPTLSISFMEIQEIVKHKNGSFTVQGLDRNAVINIPYVIENPDLLEERLGRLGTIAARSQKSVLAQFAPLGYMLLGIGLMVGMGTSKDTLPFVGCGVAVMVLLGWGFYSLHRNQYLPAGFRRLRWILLMLFASVLIQIITKFVL